jgi:serine/threonine-protein kinase
MSDTRDSLPAGAPAPGEVVAGKYRVERVLGAGGMGIVVAARHIELDERVALKVLRAEVVSPETTARFLREARSSAKIKSEHVVRVSDVGTLDAGTPFMVMELLEGKDLAAALVERAQLPVGEAVEIVLQACEAVAEAHALGIVHRDLKPANLFLARRPGGKVCVKVVDFGISKVTTQGALGEDAAMTRTSTWLGSPLYMSPEQMRSARSVDARTDIWSLGLILYQSLAGRVPFDAPSLPDLCLKVVHEEPPSLAALRPDLPEGLVAVVMRCLEKKPDARYLNVAELALDLAPFAPERARESVERIVGVIEDAGLMRPSKLPQAPPSEAPPWSEERISQPPPSSRPPVSTRAAAPAATLAEAQPSTPPPAPKEEPRRRGGVLLALIGVAVAGAAAGFFAMRPPPAPPPSLPPPALPATASAALPVVTPASTPDGGSPDGGSPDGGSPDAGVPDAGSRDAGSPDAGARDAGAAVPRAPVRPRTAHPVDPSPVPVPQGPPPSAQTCFQTLPDGSVKQVPCP